MSTSESYGPPLDEHQRELMNYHVEQDVHYRIKWLPGQGMYRRHVVALMAQYILQSASLMASQVGRRSTADALRRLADKVEDDDLAD